VRVHAAKTVSDTFHAQFDVVKKTYVYKIQTGKIPNVFDLPYTWHFPYKLDIQKMREGAKHILGEHNFEAFCASGATVTSFMRTIYDLNIEQNGDVYTITVCGNGFLYNMVRIIAGTLAYVGCGRIAPESIKEIIESRNRETAGITAPPQGLYMAKTEYESKEN
jgi:tRNA pseudouridine38-40 synthase